MFAFYWFIRQSQKRMGAQGEWKFLQLILHIFRIITVIWVLLGVEWVEKCL